MQKPKLTLEEIVYEITGECDSHCDYCGSKENWNVKADNKVIEKIIDSITEFPPKKINVSGGNPLLVDFNMHSELTRKLHNKDVFCAVIINPKNTLDYPDTSQAILELYDWIGLSLNTQNEIDIVYKQVLLEKFLKKTTIITNFNVTNVFTFDAIEEFVRINNLVWQIQFTVYNDRNDSKAIYNNEEAFKYLHSKVTISLRKGIKIIIADPANSSECGAGTQSIGILYDGSVVPCLSMRSWKNDINAITEGKLLKQTLEDIWCNYFHTQRYCEFECCKDVCKNKKLDDMLRVDDVLDELRKKVPDNIQPCEPPLKPPYRIVYYGVTPDPWRDYRVTAYAVFSPNFTCMKPQSGSFCNSVSKFENT